MAYVNWMRMNRVTSARPQVLGNTQRSLKWFPNGTTVVVDRERRQHSGGPDGAIHHRTVKRIKFQAMTAAVATSRAHQVAAAAASFPKADSRPAQRRYRHTANGASWRSIWHRIESACASTSMATGSTACPNTGAARMTSGTAIMGRLICPAHGRSSTTAPHPANRSE
jgi:hypothetical protein